MLCIIVILCENQTGNYGLLFRVLADAQDQYAFRVTTCITPSINNPEKKQNMHVLVMEISKGILSTGNITGDQLYSAVDTVEELYQKKKSNLCRNNNAKQNRSPSCTENC